MKNGMTRWDSVFVLFCFVFCFCFCICFFFFFCGWPVCRKAVICTKMMKGNRAHDRFVYYGLYTFIMTILSKNSLWLSSQVADEPRVEPSYMTEFVEYMRRGKKER